MQAQSNPEEKVGAWYSLGSSHKISNKTTLQPLAHFRFFTMTKDLQQLMLRFGVNHAFNKTISATLGYAYFNTDATFDQEGGTANEHRIYEDFNIKHAAQKFKFAHRFRLEHRFFETDTRHWIRYQIGINHPISSKLTAFTYNEVFFNFQGNTYSQNWFGLGLKRSLSKNVKAQLGYQNIALHGGANFHRIIMGISFSTNHIKKK